MGTPTPYGDQLRAARTTRRLKSTSGHRVDEANKLEKKPVAPCSLLPKRLPKSKKSRKMPKSNKTKDHKRPRARHRRAPKRAAVVADPRPLNRRVWPSLVAPILDHLLIEHVMYYTCVAKLFNDAVPFLSVVEQRKVAEHAPDRDKARHVLWQPAVWLRLSRARQVTLAIETPEALLHLAGLATASRRSWEVIDLFCSFQSDVESEGVVAQALGGLADALRHGALPELESLTVHCRGEANDWTTKLGRGAPPDVNAALAKLCVALPPYLAVTCAVEWTLAPSVCARVLADRPEVDVNRSKAYLPSALTTWADAADDSDASMKILRLLLARGADVRGGDADPSSPLSNVVHNGAARGVEALLAAGADPDAGRAVGPPLLMGCGVWPDAVWKSTSELGWFASLHAIESTRSRQQRRVDGRGARNLISTQARRRRAVPVLLARAEPRGRQRPGAAAAPSRRRQGTARRRRRPAQGARVRAPVDAPEGNR